VNWTLHLFLVSAGRPALIPIYSLTLLQMLATRENASKIRVSAGVIHNLSRKQGVSVMAGGSGPIEITTTQILIGLISTAGFGSFMSFLFAFFGQWLERRSRVKELLLSKAIDMARDRIDFLAETSKQNRQDMIIESHLVYAGELYQDLAHLFKKGKLPPQVQIAVEEYRKKIGA
jgi:hypothetical protein